MATGEAHRIVDVENVKQYTFSTEPVPRLSCSDPEAEKRIANDQPVVLTDTNLVTSALHWNEAFLRTHIGDGKFTVFTSDSHKFLYYDDKKLKFVPNFKPPTRHLEMTFDQFIDKIEDKNNSKWYYLQQGLNDTVGTQIVFDFMGFNWSWITEQQKKNGWGTLTSNLLFLGMDGVITPCHYDEQQNFFAQIKGYKRFLLFDQDMFECLYPYPVFHPHDRQSQVDFDNPDFEKFPKFRNLKGLETVLGPGDVLFLPTYWWHQVESLPGLGNTLSVNFWYKAGPVEKIVYPLTSQQKVSMMRNIEKMITDALNNTAEVAPFFQNLVVGRYT
ncbi:hypoxia-inducible factor 1-alpha inhibitor-like [Gigantopelta aegis]|uniref:hypoxia-inducible factor 1-alpha inhibitor-like n=1 Tax=Gigantopelta aegis TaxID=1735272 RepID=UPI001B88989D|nr:hypoxia-inducible factor 1-alpha inhibitor-like [Gigantopelta aegis]